ncbi:MAG: T9SS type A sorting domain-containing protein [Flavobacteriia bacterium]|nr:T9SS type A sorting domain-containing protein [Flavobacteriia bacterium]
MKKVYLLTSVLLSGLTLNAQRAENTVTAPLSRNTYTVAKKANHTPVEKAQGDLLWSNDFTTTSDWNATQGSNYAGPLGTWEILNAVPASLVTQSQAGYGFPTAMNSTSGGNFAFINSDEAGSGKTQDCYFTYTGNIDLSATTPGTALYLEFDNIYRHYQEQFYVEVSNDGGTTWTPFQVNAEVAVNVNSMDPEHDVINVTSANLAGSATVAVRLHYVGAWDWFWGVDDIKISEAWANDGLMISSIMHTDPATDQGADYYMIPTSQTSFPGQTFRSIAQNNGSATQANFRTKATCAAASYNQTSAAGMVYGANFDMGLVDTFDITTPFNPTTAGTYNVMVSTDLGTTDSYTANDTTSFRNITIGGVDYARDNGVMTSTLTSFSGTGNEIIGWYNYMNVYDPYTVGSVKTYIPTSQSSGFVTDYVWASIDKFDGTNWNEVLATTGVDITSTSFGAWLNLNSDSGPIPLEVGLHRVIFHRTEAGANTLRLAMAQASPDGTVAGLKADLTSIGLASPNAIMIRMSEDYTGGLNENTFINNVSIYPNPAVNTANVSFNLKNTSNVEITVTDVTGKVVYTNTVSNLASGTQTIEMNTESLNNGIYMVNIVSNGSKTTQKFVVKK